MELRVEAVTGKSKKVKEIYKEAFTKEERMPFFMMLLMAKNKNTDFLAFYDEDILCGFAYMAVIDNTTFVMFFAVDKTIRSKGYGSKILKKIQSLYPNNKIIVSIEKCNEEVENKEQRWRRKKFYLDNGYIETGYLIELQKIEQEILITNGSFDKDEFLSFFKQYSNGTMKPTIWKIED